MTTMQSASSVRRIGLMGGTFDPVHLGHIHLATLAREALALNEVRFIPCRRSPHKHGTLPTTGEDRLKMLTLAAAELSWAVVDDFELQSEGPNYSYETAEEMARRFPGANLYWIMGGDQWEALPRWKNPERLAAVVEFIVLARGETPRPRDGYRLHVVDGGHPASATEIRAAMAAGKSGHEWLHRSVNEWLTNRSNSL